MAGSISEAGKALIVDVSGNVPGGGSFSIKIITDNVEIAKEVCRTVAKLGEATFKIAGTLGVVYGAYKLLRPIIKGAAKKAFGGERDDQEIGEPRPGSLHVLLHCLTDERYLEVLEDYESGRMKERLLEEFSLVGIKVEGLKVEIENMVEVNKTKEAINKRCRSRINKNTSEDVKNIVVDDAQNDVKKHNQNQLYTAIMKPLPRDESALFKEINSLSLLGPNASLENPRAKLVKCINDSRNIGRSINHVSILSLGTSGVGKSSTVNHLLGVQLAEAIESQSETRSTQELTIHGRDPKYEVEELPLGLVDTPGFSDTDGSHQDACNLLSIQKFYRTHPKLSGCYPNLIFVIVKATDNRIMGENSDLGKSLRCIKQLGLVDPDKPNVVAILTHACGIPWKKWSKNLERIKSAVRRIIFKALKVFAPVVMLENAYDDYELEVRGDYTCLPNGELQPKNLYDACTEILKCNNDNLGLITLNSVFLASRKDRTTKSGHKIEAKIAKEHTLDAEERMMVDLFESAARGGVKDPIFDTVSQYIKEENLEPGETEEVMKIAGVLRQLGEGDPPNFGSHSLSSIEFSLGREISSTGRKMLEEKFKIAVKPPDTPYESESLTAIMKPLPRDKNALLEEATSLGLLGPKASLQKPRAKLVKCINNSRKIARSINHVSVILVGATGVGKSSTINHLLASKAIEHEHAETNKSQSQTRSTQEFIIYASDPEYEFGQLPLRLIDTPGFFDTDGTRQDACNLLSMETFFRTHPELSECYPNLIFFIVRATDNRIMGKNSNLRKSLKYVKLLKQPRLVDPKNPNVVAILTHACAILKKDVKKWSEELERMKSDVKQVIFEALKVAAPVVMLENAFGEDDYDLEVRGEFTCLPNGELQPKNLYTACAEVLKGNNDNLGLVTLNSVFASSTEVTSERGHKIEAKDASKCHALDDKEEKILKILESAARGGDPVDDNVSQYIQQNKPETHEEEELWKIAAILRKVVGDPPDFESVSLQLIEYHHVDKISSIGEKMLKEKFKIEKKPSCKALESGRLVGQGYNILTDKSVAAQVMKFDVFKTEYGVVIPTCAKFEKVQQTRYFMDEFENDESCTQSRLKSLNVNLNINPGMMKMDCRAGYNMKNDSTSSSSTSEYSFLFEQRMFELKIGNYEEYLENGMTFTKDFKSEVKDLPKRYKKGDRNCQNKFERFFDRFGHFLVSSAYAGGSVEVKCSRKIVDSETTSVEEVKTCLAASLEDLDVTTTEFSAARDTSSDQKARTLLNGCAYLWDGGARALHAKETIVDKEQFQKWKASLLLNPTMLTSEMNLEPIATAVRCVDASKDQSTYDALKDLLGVEMKIPVKKEKAEENTKKEATTRKESLYKLTDFFGETCFPSSSVVNVQSKDGVIRQKKMANLDVGDKVMSWDEKRNQAIFTQVIMFAHHASEAMDVEYLKIALEDGNKITLSGNHLVMVGKRKKAIMAQKVKPGDILFSVDDNLEISPKKVLAVEKVIEQGVYCPITFHGNLIVDNVLASCYASVEDHVFFEGLVKISAQSIAHFGLMPIRALHKLRSKWLRKIPNGQTIHPYVQWLCKLNLPWMAN